MSEILQNLSKIPENSQKFRFYIARASFGEKPLISCSVDVTLQHYTDTGKR